MSLVLFAATYDGEALEEVIDGAPRKLIGLVSGLDDSWEVRGEDDIVPGTSGRNPRNRLRDRLPILLEGSLLGVGTTAAEQHGDVRAAGEELRVLVDPTRDPASLVVALEDGGTATISARPLNVAAGPPTLAAVRSVSIQLEAVEDDWTVDVAGS